MGPGAQLSAPTQPLGAASVGHLPAAQRIQPHPLQAGEVSPSALASSALTPLLKGTPPPNVHLLGSSGF